MVLGYENEDCRAAAAEVLRRHEDGQAEANITSAVRDFLVVTGLAKADEIVEENPPSEGSRRAVDLTALDTFIEFKRRIGNGINPNPEYVTQLDEYLKESTAARNGVRMGILTDGKHWVLRWSNAPKNVNTSKPYGFVFPESDDGLLLFEWLRDHALVARENIEPTATEIENQFGANSPAYDRDIAMLGALYEEFSDFETVAVKRRLWHDLLRTALGEVVERNEFDDLFVRHTYLTIVVGIVVQATFGMDVNQIAENDPEDLVTGRQFAENTGLHGVVESDFFAWPVEVGADPLIRTIARRVARFDWSSPPSDIAATLYQTVIPAEERRDLGEYYTPRWLAKAIVDEIVTDPLNQRVLDPSCGSGTFVAECVEHFLEAAKRQKVPDTKLFEMLRDSVTGIDVHPVATHLARAAWVIAAKPAIAKSASTAVTVPIYLGDSLQLRYRSRDLFATNNVPIDVGDDKNTQLLFPVALVNHAENFDQMMVDIADYIERGEDPKVAMDAVPLTDDETQVLSATIDKLVDLHVQGRDHIWAYYIRNLVRPIALARNKVDVIVGNPPWINYNQTTDVLRDELVNQSRNVYGIWAGGRHASNQDVASLFYARCVDLYLRDGGLIGFVMPHSALQAGQHTKWRTGEWKARGGARTLSVNFQARKAWDLEQLRPNDFFPIPSSVVFAERRGEDGKARPLAGTVSQWLGATGTSNVRRVDKVITDTSAGFLSPYGNRTRRGADIIPRVLFFVNEVPNPTSVHVGGTVTTEPRRGRYDKQPWKSLDLTVLQRNTLEEEHIFDVHLGETVVPYATLNPHKAALPVKRGAREIAKNSSSAHGIDARSLSRRMQPRWHQINQIWEDNKSAANRLALLGRLDYFGNLSAQLEWQNDHNPERLRVVYTSAGVPTAAILTDNLAIADYKLFWVDCASSEEADYLLAIINSDALYAAAKPIMSRGQWGARDLQKHLWRLPIPEFDGGNSLHVDVADAGRDAAAGVERELGNLRQRYPQRLTVTIARREVRKWLRESSEGKRVEEVVGGLLGG